jgi:hypothetical protein
MSAIVGAPGAILGPKEGWMFRSKRSKCGHLTTVNRQFEANCDLLSLASKSQRSDGRARATPGNHQIKFLRLRLLKHMGG